MGIKVSTTYAEFLQMPHNFLTFIDNIIAAQLAIRIHRVLPRLPETPLNKKNWIMIFIQMEQSPREAKRLCDTR